MSIIVSGILTDPTGAPMPYLNIVIRAVQSVPGASSIPNQAAVIESTSAAGAYSFTLEVGTYAFSIQGGGIGSSVSLGQGVVNYASLNTDLFTLIGISGIPITTVQAAIVVASQQAATTVAVGTTTTVAPGTPASVANVGTSTALVLDFEVPKGETGATGPTGPTGATGTAATIAVGTVTELAPGDTPTITNSGTSADATFDFGIPAASITALQNDTQPISVTDGNFSGTINQSPGAGANNETPFAQYGDLFSDAIVTTPTPTFPTSTTLSSTAPALVAYVLGQRVVYAGGSYTVGASATSYLDLSNTGVLTVTTSATVTANSLRLATVTSSATAITGVVVTADVYPDRVQGAPFLKVTNTSVSFSPTLATSTTGGTIAASTTKYYVVLPVLNAGSLFPNGNALPTGITTGSTTATNSNTISWGAVAGAVSYNVYEGPGNTLANFPSFGLIGNTTSLTFVDTGITPGAVMPGTIGIGGAFTVVPFSTVASDTASGWHSATNSYTIPKTGNWLVLSNLRYQDGSPSGISFSLNTDPVVYDSPSNVWFMTPTPASGQTARQGALNGRIAHFTKGTIVSMFSYAGTPMNAQAAALSLLYMGA